MTNGEPRPSLILALALGLCAMAAFAGALLPTSVVGLGHWTYLPFAAKPVPTATPTPTLTPTPRLMDVRVEGSCSQFRGGSQQDPNGEWVCFKNYDWQRVDMTDWRVEDASRHTYCFPPFVLDPGAIVRLRSGPGADTTTDLHWARGLIWNNDHDRVYLYDHLDRLVSRYVY